MTKEEFEIFLKFVKHTREIKAEYTSGNYESWGLINLSSVVGEHSMRIVDTLEKVVTIINDAIETDS